MKTLITQRPPLFLSLLSSQIPPLSPPLFSCSSHSTSSLFSPHHLLLAGWLLKWHRPSRNIPASCRRSSPVLCAWTCTAIPTCFLADTTFARTASTAWSARQSEVASAARSAATATALAPTSRRTSNSPISPTTTGTGAGPRLPLLQNPQNRRLRLWQRSRPGLCQLFRATTVPPSPPRRRAAVPGRRPLPPPFPGMEVTRRPRGPPPPLHPRLPSRRVWSARCRCARSTWSHTWSCRRSKSIRWRSRWTTSGGESARTTMRYTGTVHQHCVYCENDGWYTAAIQIWCASNSRYYCMDDKTCVCNACTIEGGHSGHTIKTLKNTMKDLKVQY